MKWQEFAGFFSGAQISLPLIRQNFRLTTTAFLAIVAGTLAAAIFIADTITNLEIAFPAFYTAVVLIAARICKKRGVILVGIGCIGLTLLSDLLTVNEGVSEAGFVNTVISLLTITATTLLALKLETEKEATYQAKSQLAHIGRVTTLGEITASIAHQVNQPLAAVMINGNACLQWLDAQPPNLDEARRNVAHIVKDANRAHEIIVEVRNLTKGSPLKIDWLEPNEIILSTTALIDAEIRQNDIAVQTELSEDVPLVQGDRVLLQQVVLNLLLNAIEAMEAVHASSRRLIIRSSKNHSNSAVISIEDSGRGFDPRSTDRLFDAFYTTKRDGMGMGLAISRSIVEAHGGHIWAALNLPSGASVQFELPGGGTMSL
jgi:C4-dicarboxylate-specific signal transduction histidine kinase